MKWQFVGTFSVNFVRMSASLKLPFRKTIVSQKVVRIVVLLPEKKWFKKSVWCKFMEKFRLLPAKLESNADFALQNHGDTICWGKQI